MNITIDGVQYEPVSEPGSRHVVVVDRGWIFAGNMTRENGRIKLTHCVWVFRWESCGFAAVIADPSKADIRPFADIDIPEGSEIYSIPVSDGWGLK
jgi:hypothetical protein